MKSKVIYAYDGNAYTVLPCFVREDSHIFYCGAYLESLDNWHRVLELEPRMTECVAWEDLEAFVEGSYRKTMEKEGAQA